MNLPSWLAYAGAVVAIVYATAVTFKKGRTVTQLAFAVGMLGLAAESVLSGLALRVVPAAEFIQWQSWKIVALAFLVGPWVFFSHHYARGPGKRLSTWKRVLLFAISLPPPVVVLLFRSDLIVAVRPTPYAFQPVLMLGWPALVAHLGLLLGAVVALANLELTYRAAVGTVRWRIKFMLLGLGVFFAVRIYTSSQALLFRSLDASHAMINIAALLACLVVISRSLLRSGHFKTDVYPSQAALSGSLTIILAGTYLVVVGLFAKVAAYFGDERSLALKVFLILLAVVGLAMALLSDRARLHLRRFISRHFQRPFYDYRTAWRSFTESTATQLDQTELCRTLIKRVADLFQAKSVSIWVVGDDGDGLNCAASSSLPEKGSIQEKPSARDAAALLDYFRQNPEPVEFDTQSEPWAETLRQCHPKLFKLGGARVAVPLRAGGTVLGVLLLGDRVSGGGFAIQDLDMLRCVGDHAAAGLQNIRLARRLLQSRELEAFQAMATFFVHDLKNAASTLNLMLPNLPIHWDNPEFRADALRGITKTVGHINALIGRLSQLRHELKIQPVEADLNSVVSASLDDWKAVPNVTLSKQLAPLPPVRIDRDQIQTVLTNLVLNARDATLATAAARGEVRVSTRAEGMWAVISVADNGCGMPQNFINQSLFKPFQTTKKNGLGIGMFQSKMIVEAHGGRLAVESAVGKGTTFHVLLPLQPPSKSADKAAPGKIAQAQEHTA